MFQVVFDYDEDHYKEIPLDNTIPKDEQHQFVQAAASAGGIWSGRPDTFSEYRSSFEIRTYRRCHRVLMFHRFPKLEPNRIWYVRLSLIIQTLTILLDHHPHLPSQMS